MNVLDLFSGIGGFSLGLEKAGGFKTVAFCEIDPFARAILAKHWPGVPIFGDICELTVHEGRLVAHPDIGREPTAEQVRAGGQVPGECRIDVICGGFPCQDISIAGKGAGLAGERSGLWREYARLIGEIRPQYVIVENVSALLSRGLGDVLGDLAALGYDAEWHCIPASYVGAPHRRDRVWIVAYPNDQRELQSQGRQQDQLGRTGDGSALENAQRIRLEESGWLGRRGDPAKAGEGETDSTVNAGWWSTEPDVGRVANGVPARVDRLRGLGNAVVPQVVEMIGRAVMRAAGESASLSEVKP